MDETPLSPSEASDEAAPSPDDRLSDSALLDEVGDGVYQLDRDGNFVAINDAVTAITGYDREALLGSHASAVLDADDAERAEATVRERILSGDEDSVLLTLRVVTATDERVPCEVCASPVVRDGEFRGTVGVVRETAGLADRDDRENSDTETPDSEDSDGPDASERRQAFDALAEASADGIIMLDDESVIQYANPAVERILGHEPEELVGGSKMTIIPDRLRKVHAEALQRYLDTGEKHIDWTYVELPGRHADGHEVPLAISLNEFEHDGEHFFVGTFRDISERKAVERELERQNDRLDRFASMLAHELRNPLQTAQIYLDFVDDEVGSDGEDVDDGGSGADEAIPEVADALVRIDEIIDLLLVLARSSDEIDGQEPVRLADAAAEAWANTDAGTTDFDVDTAQVLRVNPMHLQHLLENLFRNSVEHAGDDVTIRVGALDRVSASEASGGSTDGDVGVSAEQSEDEARQGAERTVGGFYVEDDGPGIPEDERENVVQAGYTTGTEGIGLGLTFVAQLADAYGWEYAITESDAGGARFEFTGVETVDSDADAD